MPVTEGASLRKTAGQSRTEVARADPVKAGGLHYTPSELADFLARRTLSHIDGDDVTVLDPACGDAALMIAASRTASSRGLGGLRVFGFDQDLAALSEAESRLKDAAVSDPTLVHLDFLSSAVANDQGELLDLPETIPDSLPRQFDVVISNPPYVRTQVLGSEQARRLAQQFGLTGRVDLYQAFICAMTTSLKRGGTLGLLTSNRFLSTQSGASVRRFLWDNYQLLELYDFGDTKLFEASVLPVILVARRGESGGDQTCTFRKIYEWRGAIPRDSKSLVASSVIEALDRGDEGHVQIGTTLHEIESGKVHQLGGPSEPWILSNAKLDEWLERVAAHTDATFGDIVKIRVGVKTTADNVFVRDDWDTLPEERRPEPDLLRPLLTHKSAEKWRAREERGSLRVLYPHLTRQGRRYVIPLTDFPRAAAYLAEHKEQLQARNYVLDAGRAWYEIWVPQNPEDWPRPKIVFPDISETPRFFLDETGAVVQGDSYWIPLNGSLDRETALTLLAVANSSFALRFYDAVCVNRLYSGRRRFITQYVQRFPLPAKGRLTSRLVSCVEELLKSGPAADDRRALEDEVNELVNESFGVVEERPR
jgi:adenine-specific DNA-methyltransferase